jgi:hypothetical protein
LVEYGVHAQQVHQVRSRWSAYARRYVRNGELE